MNSFLTNPLEISYRIVNLTLILFIDDSVHTLAKRRTGGFLVSTRGGLRGNPYAENRGVSRGSTRLTEVERSNLCWWPSSC